MCGISSKVAQQTKVCRCPIGVFAIVLACAWMVSATPGLAQISPGPRPGVGGEGGSSFRLYKPQFSDYPLRVNEAPPPVPEAAEESTTVQTTVRPGPSPEGDAEDRLRVLNVRPTMSSRGKRNARSKVEDPNEPTQSDVAPYDPLGLQDSAAMAWRGGKPDASQDTAANATRLRSSLWRRGLKLSDGSLEALEERRMRGAASKREVLTGGVRAGAPPARPGYGAPVDPRESASLNAAKSLFIDSDPQRFGR